jgi:transposase
MAEPCPDCLRLRQEVAALKAQIEQLRHALEQSQRAGKRQAAPFAKGPPKEQPKTPGRKAGDAHGQHGHRPPPTPDHIDECHEAPLPPACPDCGAAILELDVVQQYQTEIPRQPLIRQFNIHRGQCQGCAAAVQGRHPLQTSDATGAAASQVGPDAQAAVVYLNKHAGLSHGKVVHALRTLFGITLSRGASAQIVLRAGRRLQPAYQEIQQRLKESAVITPDETGWRIGGHPVWLHGWVGDDRVTCYHIDPQRSADALEEVVGRDWSGTMVHDGWSSYDRFREACHQQCQAHVLRRAHDLEEAAAGRAKVFPRQVIDLFQESLRVRDEFAQTPPTVQRREQVHEEFTDRLLELTRRPRADAANERLAAHLHGHAEHWFLFLIDAAVPATNYRAEQAMRPAVVNRKVWGGNRTAAGAEAQAITTSVLQTCKQQAKEALDYVSQTLRGFVTSLFTSIQDAARR